MSEGPETSYATSRRSQVMVGELPGDFLRIGCPNQQQYMTDERVAQILQAQQQAGYTTLPANIRGKLCISVVQAKLVKNYGLTRMDPYCRIRVGHSVIETPTASSGGKNPQWAREVQCYLPHGVENIYVEIFDEKSFTNDDRIAWSYITIPHASLNGETVDEWFQLSGRQGDEKEGSINLILSFTPVDQIQTQAPVVMPQVYTFPPVGVYPPQQIPMQPPLEQGPGYSPEEFNMVKEMFPNMEEEVIKSVFAANGGNKDATINSLLQMSAD